ncbi:hypothetical protein Y032_0087g2081 [Ancylostoma ceylanicum]|nr:hypothetical protein Y032_0087g2081 [Ancylostoma ceylanicum]
MRFLLLLCLALLVNLSNSLRFIVDESALDVVEDLEESVPRVKRQFGWGPWWSYRPWGGFRPWFWRPYYGGGWGWAYGWG